MKIIVGIPKKDQVKRSGLRNGQEDKSLTGYFCCKNNDFL